MIVAIVDVLLTAGRHPDAWSVLLAAHEAASDGLQVLCLRYLFPCQDGVLNLWQDVPFQWGLVSIYTSRVCMVYESKYHQCRGCIMGSRSHCLGASRFYTVYRATLQCCLMSSYHGL